MKVKTEIPNELSEVLKENEGRQGRTTNEKGTREGTKEPREIKVVREEE